MEEAEEKKKKGERKASEALPEKVRKSDGGCGRLEKERKLCLAE